MTRASLVALREIDLLVATMTRETNTEVEVVLYVVVRGEDHQSRMRERTTTPSRQTETTSESQWAAIHPEISLRAILHEGLKA